MNYEQLSDIVRDVEKKSDLIKIPSHFYAELRAYIKEMEAELNNASPDAPDYRILEDELKTVHKFADKILLRRVNKIMELAGLSALKGLSVDKSAMLSEEYDMLCDMADIIGRMKNKTLYGDTGADNAPREVMHKKTSDSSKPIDKSAITDTPCTVIAKKDMQSDTNAMQHDENQVKNVPCESCKLQTWDDYVLVRAVADISTFSGPDGREYALIKDEIATIPDAIAKIFINRRVAVEIFINKEVGNA